MLAGGDFIMHSMTGIPLAFGLAMTLLGGIIVVLGIEKIRLLNAVLVPLIVLSIILVFVKLPTPAHSLPFMLSKPILYSGLDVFAWRCNRIQRRRKSHLQRNIFVLHYDLRIYVRNVVYAPNSSFIRPKRKFNARFSSFRQIAYEVGVWRFDSGGNIHDARIFAENRQ